VVSEARGELDDEWSGGDEGDIEPFDFKGSISKIEWDAKDMGADDHLDDEFKLKNVMDVLNTRMAKRGLPLKNFTPQKARDGLGATVRQVVKAQNGIPSDKAKRSRLR